MKNFKLIVTKFLVLRLLVSGFIVFYGLNYLRLPEGFLLNAGIPGGSAIKISEGIWKYLFLSYFVSGILIIIPKFTRWAALVCYIVTVLCINQVPSMVEIHIAHINFVLIYVALFSNGKSLEMPDVFRQLTAYYFSMSYFCVGLSKFLSANWMSGNGILSFWGLVEKTMGYNFSSHLDIVFTYMIPLTECAGILYFFIKKTRSYIHFAFISMHLFIGLSTVLDYLSFSMIIFQYFIWYVNIGSLRHSEELHIEINDGACRFKFIHEPK